MQNNYKITKQTEQQQQDMSNDTFAPPPPLAPIVEKCFK